MTRIDLCLESALEEYVILKTFVGICRLLYCSCVGSDGDPKLGGFEIYAWISTVFFIMKAIAVSRWHCLLWIFTVQFQRTQLFYALVTLRGFL